MLIIKTQTREFSIRDGNGEAYFDLFCRMLLDGEVISPVNPPVNPPIATPPVETPVEPPAEIRYPKSTQQKENHIPERTYGEREEGFKGFMHLTCSRCGRTKTFFAKERIKTYRCHDCDKDTELHQDDMRKAYTSCECGTDAHYWTNSVEGEFDIPCINCGAPVSVSWNHKKKCYETMK